ncbi:MAG TPA: zinc ribbon domain-containing protein [Dehalococcoidia bacterium]|nr:zinc ribbon domain-containing protein [Dehalococcoidia bacterium]
MPIYEYECKSCGEKFELRRGMNDSDDEIRCPACGARGPRRVFSVFGLASPESGVGSSSGACAPSSGFA